MSRIAILKTGSTRLTDTVRRRGGDYETWFAEVLQGAGADTVVIDAVRGALPSTRDWDGIVITGSPASVHDLEPWSERASAWIAAEVADNVPVLGVCYGHQLLAHALGGETGPAAVHEVGMFPVQITSDDRLFADLPSRLPTYLIHYNEVTTLPPGASVLAHSERCPIQAFAFGDHVRAVQWHPEFDAGGVREAISQDADTLRARGEDAGYLAEQVREVPYGTVLLENFVHKFVESRTVTAA